jgi:hypothetical protein
MIIRHPIPNLQFWKYPSTQIRLSQQLPSTSPSISPGTAGFSGEAEDSAGKYHVHSHRVLLRRFESRFDGWAEGSPIESGNGHNGENG